MKFLKLNHLFRNTAKLLAKGLVVVLAASTLFLGHVAEAATNSGGNKVLTVFYSRTGNTRDMAKLVHGIVGGDIVELQPAHSYPEGYRATTEQAKKELEANFMPPLKTTVEDISQYDVIFVGSPSWWGTFASTVRAFLSQHDFSGKTVVPFITHEGSGLGDSMNDLKRLCPTAIIKEGLAIRGGRVSRSQTEINNWLKRIEIAQ